VYAIEHPFEKEEKQYGLLKLPPAPPSFHETAQDGVLIPQPNPFMEAVNVMVFPIATYAGLGLTLTLVLILATVRLDVPELLTCALSPGKVAVILTEPTAEGGV